MKILACVVTYNRSELLARCVDAIRGQRRPPDRLLVINNGSTDDTVAMLEAKGVECLTQENVGSAGGWARSISEALAGDYDAVWLMDDDGFPDREALGLLEQALTPDRACVSSVVLQENARDRFVFPMPLLNDNQLPVLAARRRKLPTLTELRAEVKGDLYPFAHLFNGALVSTQAARAIGNVTPDFFLFGDEVDYFMRLRSFGPVLSHLGAHHYHPDVAGRPLTPEKAYYYVKNTIILNRRYFDARPVRHAAAVAAALWRTGRRNGWKQAAALVAGRNAPLAKAVARGLKGQIGRDYGR
ncbi:glycosyltransferase family 2 protein [Sphingomonas swuensis]|uniref:Glycosyltransferase family 2 protein n=1 Tax=Sphingomonas swuensis TaxID=977800 RepID=A0ABP7SYX9_9SPHN